MRKICSILFLLLLLTACSDRKKSETGYLEPAISKEQLFVNYLYSLRGKSYDAYADSLRSWFRRYQRDTAMLAVVEKYLYDPNSPYRNEELYLPFVHELVQSEYTADSLREAYAYDEKMCSLNRVNTQAADFEFETLQGKRETLYKINGKYTLLIFNNPGCEACKEVIELLSRNDRIYKAVLEESLAVVNVYIDDDIALWKKSAKEYPSRWHSGFDPNHVIRTDCRYNVRAIPSLYILDEKKKVIMKDAPVEKVNYFLTNALN